MSQLPHYANRLLACLSPATLSAIEPHLEPCEFRLRQTIYEAGQANEYAYFIASGLGSVLIGTERTTGVEIGVIGRDGMMGLPIVLGSVNSPQTTFIQKEGSGWRISAADLRAAMAAHPELHELLLKYVHYFLQQVSATAYANADFTVEERLARWLLVCHDRQDGDEITLTHEFLALMLGVRRPGVTVATHVLEGNGLIKATRGMIRVLDRAKLEEVAGLAYGVAEGEYARLFGSA